MVFNTVPSKLKFIYWQYTFKDLKFAIQLYIEKEQIRYLQEFENLAIIVNKALGGSSGNKKMEVNNVNQAKAAFNSLFNTGR